MITPSEDGPDLEPDDPLAVILRPASGYLAPPPGGYEAIRRDASRRRVLRAAAGVGLSCVAAALIALPFRLAASDAPVSPTVPLAPPPSSSPSTPPTPSPSSSRPVTPSPSRNPSDSAPSAGPSVPNGSGATTEPTGPDSAPTPTQAPPSLEPSEPSTAPDQVGTSAESSTLP
ncbi:hypothetical protein [Streptomyces phaeochromogenes]|uniref:hypothetical protein n=1 Tax=Streptomyces phaeochromogenes TaxID=1923 RepID=UPI0006E25DD9|nr:hypothetical protein [Streptomyces phaeochromogenes]